jgi:uncharacterized membrane protein YeaQ/YmgE (transglycosylase-associated protein family)
MGIITLIVVGVAAGLLARSFIPGNQSLGLITTAVLGSVGSFLGALLALLLGVSGRTGELHPVALLLSTLGAMGVLLLVGLANGRRYLHA